MIGIASPLDGLPSPLGVNVASAIAALSLPDTRLFDGLYQRSELLFSSLVPLSPLLDNGTDKVAFAVDTSQGVNVTASGSTRTFSGLGAEKVTNGTFATDTTGWTESAVGAISAVGGRLRVEMVVQFDRARQSVTTEVGKTYIFEYEAYAGTTAPLVRLGSTSDGTQYLNAGAGAASVVFIATTTTTYVSLWVNNNVTTGAYAEFDNVSVKEIPGIHGVQTTPNDKPSYDWDNLTLDYPGTTQHLDYLNAALGDDVVIMMLVKIPASDTDAILIGGPASEFALIYDDGNTSTTLSSGAGSPSYRLNGVSASWSTRDDVHTAIATDAWSIVGIHGADLSASAWRDLRLSGYGNATDQNIDGLVKASVAMQAPSLADRNQAGNYLASLIDGLSYTDET